MSDKGDKGSMKSTNDATSENKDSTEATILVDKQTEQTATRYYPSQGEEICEIEERSKLLDRELYLFIGDYWKKIEQRELLDGWMNVQNDFVLGKGSRADDKKAYDDRCRELRNIYSSEITEWSRENASKVTEEDSASWLGHYLGNVKDLLLGSKHDSENQ
ncbi:uncharacterized protein I206_105595 [Kwoniella pini CBS 10737]|uniref:Uncharacterized protein n=1 Tax=Kwoniella pini CBS 10737 TaxID=1296096 RepID=A0A1B9I3T3_9TREE|nr:uncharacterized protein I206_03504 [Kwoniella pini CBS 10737]OCF50185.1 hypothetical protein I206_03504 [Kwoniella pini CBS 10737]